MNTAYVFACQAVWRLTGLRSAGRALVGALGSADDGVRVIAGMFLVRAGQRAEPLLKEAMHNRQALPMVLSILADIGDQGFEPELRQFTRDGDPEVAQAAQEALRVLAAHH
jgi:HEAT repeat protein